MFSGVDRSGAVASPGGLWNRPPSSEPPANTGRPWQRGVVGESAHDSFEDGVVVPRRSFGSVRQRAGRTRTATGTTAGVMSHQCHSPRRAMLGPFSHRWNRTSAGRLHRPIGPDYGSGSRPQSGSPPTPAKRNDEVARATFSATPSATTGWLGAVDATSRYGETRHTRNALTGDFRVGLPGFEPGTSASRTQRANQAAPQPVRPRGSRPATLPRPQPAASSEPLPGGRSSARSVRPGRPL